jgi:hypothetical protein
MERKLRATLLTSDKCDDQSKNKGLRFDAENMVYSCTPIQIVEKHEQIEAQFDETLFLVPR